MTSIELDQEALDKAWGALLDGPPIWHGDIGIKDLEAAILAYLAHEKIGDEAVIRVAAKLASEIAKGE